MLLDGHHLGTCHPGTCHWPLRELTLNMLFTLQQVSYQTTCSCPREYSSIKAPMPVYSKNPISVMHSHYDRWHVEALMIKSSLIIYEQIHYVTVPTENFLTKRTSRWQLRCPISSRKVTGHIFGPNRLLVFVVNVMLQCNITKFHAMVFSIARTYLFLQTAVLKRNWFAY